VLLHHCAEKPVLVDLGEILHYPSLILDTSLQDWRHHRVLPTTGAIPASSRAGSWLSFDLDAMLDACAWS